MNYKNYLTFRIESFLGAIFVSIWALFLMGILLIAIKNFNSDIEILNSGHARIRGISQAERNAIQEWVTRNNINIPEGKGYKYLIKEYSGRPWLFL